MEDKKLLVVGELNIDLIINQIHGFPQIGHEITAEEMDFTLGSSSAIMASNIAAMGTATFFCGKIGADRFGDFVLSELQKKNVETNFISKSSSHKTGITIVLNYEQDRANVTYCGAMEDLIIHDLPWNELNQFSHFHLSNYFLQKGIQPDILEIFKKAKAAGLTTSLDLQVDPEDRWDFNFREVLPYVDIFFPNLSELLRLTGKHNLESAILALEPYMNTLAIKRGTEGSLLISGEERLEMPSFINQQFKDAIGAGDSFNAGFLHEFLKGSSWEVCLKNGNLMGSLNTTCAGGTTAFTSASEIELKKQQIENKEL